MTETIAVVGLMVSSLIVGMCLAKLLGLFQELREQKRVTKREVDHGQAALVAYIKRKAA